MMSKTAVVSFSSLLINAQCMTTLNPLATYLADEVVHLESTVVSPKRVKMSEERFAESVNL